MPDNPTDLSEPTLSVSLGGTGGTILSMDCRGAWLEFPKAISLPLGEEVRLQFTSEHCGRLPLFGARVLERKDEPAAHCYRFSFQVEGPAQGEVLEVLLGLRERRTELRVIPDSAAPIRVAIGGGASEALAGSVENISTQGVGIALDSSAEDAFFSTDTVQIAFRLPGYEPVIHITGKIRHRSLTDTGVYYGVQFRPGLTKEFESQNKAIRSYVDARRSEMFGGPGNTDPV